MKKTSILCSALVLAPVMAGLASTTTQAADLNTQKAVIASISGVKSTPGPVVQKAIEMITESQHATEVKERHERMKHADSDQIVDSGSGKTHHDIDKVLIMGGGAALPM